MFDNFKRIYLGTIQIGLSYGLNASCPDKTQAFRLLDAAWDRGIRCFDTARAYGKAEQRIGQWMLQSGKKPTIVTKIPRLNRMPESDRAAVLDKSISTSLKELGVDHIDQCLSHDVLDFYEPYYRDRVLALKERGIIGSFGVSCYTPSEAIKALELSNELGMAQLPASVIDRRAESVGLSNRLRDVGAIMVARSLFLQGTLLLQPHKLPAHLAPLVPALETLNAVAIEYRTTPQCLAIAYVLSRHRESCVVLGFRSSTQLRALDMLPDSLVELDEAITYLHEKIGPLPDTILDPRTWPR